MVVKFSTSILLLLGVKSTLPGCYLFTLFLTQFCSFFFMLFENNITSHHMASCSFPVCLDPPLAWLFSSCVVQENVMLDWIIYTLLEIHTVGIGEFTTWSVLICSLNWLVDHSAWGKEISQGGLIVCIPKDCKSKNCTIFNIRLLMGCW